MIFPNQPNISKHLLRRYSVFCLFFVRCFGETSTFSECVWMSRICSKVVFSHMFVTSISQPSMNKLMMSLQYSDTFPAHNLQPIMHKQ